VSPIRKGLTMNRYALSCVPLMLAALTSPAQADAWWLETEAAPVPQRFLIERVMPGASKTPAAELRAGAAKSNAVLRDLGPDIQWVHSYVAGDKVYCVYQASSESLIREHAKRSGFPADKITPIVAVLDPTTASR
jgi:hypothetical protein